MKQALLLFALLIALFRGGYEIAGYRAVYLIGYGAVALMALMIAATFLWLWVVRATPLALGMAFSWAGAGLVLGWWWLFHVLEQPRWGLENPFLFNFLSLYVVGAVLHFSVIQRSFGQSGMAFLMPVLGAVGLSAALFFVL